MDADWLLGDGKEDFEVEEAPAYLNRSGTITLQGNLFNTNLAELFLTITNSQMSGALYVTQGKKEKVLVFSEQGVGIKSNQLCEPRPLFGESLIKEGRIGNEHLTYALQVQEKEGHTRFVGQVLIELGYIQNHDIEVILQYQIRSELLELFQWQRAEFQFYQGQDETEHPEVAAFLQDVGFDTRRFVIDLADKFQTLSRVKNLGTLTVQGEEEGEQKMLLIHFGNNQVSFRSLGNRTQLFGDRLVELSLATDAQIENALQIQQQAILNSSQAEFEENQLHLGQILFEQGIVSQEQVQEVLRYQVEKDFSNAMLWENLTFYYHPDEKFDDFSERDPHLINIQFDPFAFSINAFIISKRWTDIYKLIPNAREILPIKSGLIIDVNNIRLELSLDQIRSAINRPFKVEEIKELSGEDLSGFDLTVALAHLIRDSIEEIVDELRQLAKLYHINSIFSKESKTLELITTFLPKDLQCRVELAETFEKIDQVYAAQLYLQLSQYHEDSAKIKEFLNKAASLDPNNPEVTDYLIQGLLRTGEDDAAIQSGKEFFYSLVDSKNMERAEMVANYFIQANVGGEEFHNLLIESYEKQGNLSRAIREYETLIRYLRKVGREDEAEEAQHKVIELEDRNLTAQSRAGRDTFRIIKPKKTFSFVKLIVLLALLAGGGYGVWIQFFAIQGNGIKDGGPDDPKKKLIGDLIEIDKIQKDLMPAVEKFMAAESFDAAIARCKEILRSNDKISKGDAKRNKLKTSFEKFAKLYEKQARDQKKLYADHESNLLTINKGDPGSIELLKEFLEKTPFSKLKKKALSVLGALEKREKRGKEQVEKINDYLAEGKFKTAYAQIKLLKEDLDLSVTRAAQNLKYFTVIKVVPFSVKLKYKDQSFGKTPYIAYLNQPDSFNEREIVVEAGFSPLNPVKRNPLVASTDREKWERTFEITRKVAWSFRGEGSFRVPAFVNPDNYSVALGDSSGNFYVLFNGKIAYKYSIERGRLNKEINYPCVYNNNKYCFTSRDKKLYCVEPDSDDDGLIWEHKMNSIIHGLTHDGKNVIVFDSGIGVRSFDFKTGKEQNGWKETKKGFSYTTPIVYNKKLFCTLEYKKRLYLQIYDINTKRRKLNKSIAKSFLNRRNYGTVYHRVGHGQIFFTNLSGEIISYNYEKRAKGTPIRFSNSINDPLFLKNEILISCYDGKVYCYDYDGKLKWEEQVAKEKIQLISPPVLKGDYIFVATDENRVYAYHKPSKRTQWFFQTNDLVNHLEIHGNILILSGEKTRGDQLIALDLTGIK